MTGHIIHTPSRKDRMENILKQSQEQGFEYRLWPAVEHVTGVTGCTKAHKAIVRWAKDTDQPCVWIMEDDVMFLGPGAAHRFIEEIPTIYSIYTAGMYGIHKFWSRDDCYDYPKSMSGTHCYVIHQKWYDTFLALPEDIHLDLAISQAHKPNNSIHIVLSRPVYALQIPGHSDILNQDVDYNNDKYLWQYELYKG